MHQEYWTSGEKPAPIVQDSNRWAVILLDAIPRQARTYLKDNGSAGGMVGMTAMQAQYALIRYVPSALREEFINVGVVLVCPAVNFQEIQSLPSFDTSKGKLSVIEGADGRFVKHAVNKLAAILKERRIDELIGARSAPDGVMSLDGLAILRSTYHNNIQISEPRMLLTEDPATSLLELYKTFVET